MTDIRASILSALSGDSTLMAFLAGGIYSGIEISRQNSPAAFDANKELLPCALLSVSSDVPIGPYTEAGAVSSRMIITVSFYERFGHATIDQAAERAFALLNRKSIGDHVWEIRWTDDVRDIEDDILEAAMLLSRYQVVRLRV